MGTGAPIPPHEENAVSIADLGEIIISTGIGTL
jgi:hypothetical protein